MARAGPNQDVNDPTTMLEVNKFYYDQSASLGILKAISDSQNPVASGAPVSTINIPLRLSNGSTSFLDGSIVTDEFTADDPNLSSAVLNTYIDLAERFREYWELFKSSILSLTDFEVVDTSDIDPIPSTGLPGALIYHTSGSLGGTSYETSDTSFSVTTSDTPFWSGSGPTDYNQNTYPQLLTALEQLEASSSTIYSDVDEIYYWLNVKSELVSEPITGNRVIMASDSFFRVDDTSTIIESIQIPNFSNTENKIVDLTLSASYVRNIPSGFFIVNTEVVSVSSDVAIDNHNTAYGSLSFVNEQDSSFAPSGSSVSISVSQSREVTIPPNKSAFIEITTIANGDIGANVAGSMVGTTSIGISYPSSSKTRGPTISSISWPTS